MTKDNLKDETANSTNTVLADSLPLFTINEVGRMIYEFMIQYEEGMYDKTCNHTIEAIEEYKKDKLNAKMQKR